MSRSVYDAVRLIPAVAGVAIASTLLIAWCTDGHASQCDADAFVFVGSAYLLFLSILNIVLWFYDIMNH